MEIKMHTSDSSYVVNGKSAPCKNCINKNGYCQPRCTSYQQYEKARADRRKVIAANRGHYLTLNRYERLSAAKKKGKK